jgi:hypothetical protein
MPKFITVVLPEEFQELYDSIDNIAREKHQSLSRTARDILCESLSFTPGRDVKKRDMYKNKPKKVMDEKK